MMTAREAALKAVAAFRRNNAWSGAYLDNIISKEKLSQRDAALASRICYGVLQNLYLCDFYISGYSTVAPEKMEPMVLDILRTAVYQIVFMTKIPDSAAVNEAVKLTKKYANKRASGLVNAVLRKVSLNKDNLPDIKDDDPFKALSIKYSHPVWLVKKIAENFGLEECEEFLCDDNAAVLPCAQINTLHTGTEEVLKKLEAEGISAKKHKWLNDCIEIIKMGNIENISPFKDGDIYIQDPAAKLAVIAADVKPEMFVIDGCSAPGGKSFSAAVQMKNRGRILSCDIHEKKLNLIENGAKRLGIDIIETKCLDGRNFVCEYEKKADVVIADVPCSGIGVIRKKPEIRFKNQEEFKNLPEIQLDILNNLSKYVKPGGTLVYSTCTVLREENEGVIENFLKENSAFSAEKFTLPQKIGDVESGYITLSPQRYGTDGFFICKMRRKEQ